MYRVPRKSFYRNPIMNWKTAEIISQEWKEIGFFHAIVLQRVSETTNLPLWAIYGKLAREMPLIPAHKWPLEYLKDSQSILTAQCCVPP